MAGLVCTSFGAGNGDRFGGEPDRLVRESPLGRKGEQLLIRGTVAALWCPTSDIVGATGEESLSWRLLMNWVSLATGEPKSDVSSGMICSISGIMLVGPRSRRILSRLVAFWCTVAVFCGSFTGVVGRSAPPSSISLFNSARGKFSTSLMSGSES